MSSVISSDQSSESNYSSDEQLGKRRRSTRAKTRQQKKQKLVFSQREEWIESEKSERPKRNQNQVNRKYNYQESCSEDEQSPLNSEDEMIAKEEDLIDDEMNSIFFPQIEVILWKRKENDIDYYLVKYKGYSYLHLDWLQEEDICTNKQGKNRLVRFNRSQWAGGEEGEGEGEDDQFFDPSYIEVDRLLYTTDMFPQLHPKKALEMKSKWSESLLKVVQYLLNYTKNDVRYGVFFMEPVNPSRDGCHHYSKVISNPMDLGTIINRIYLDCYSNYMSVWQDIGLVFTNCRKFNTNSQEEIRIIGDTLREVALQLYQKWYVIQSKKYCTHKEKYNRQHPQQHNDYAQQLIRDIEQHIGTNYNQEVTDTIHDFIQEINAIPQIDYSSIVAILLQVFIIQQDNDINIISIDQQKVILLKQELSKMGQDKVVIEEENEEMGVLENELSLDQIEKFNCGDKSIDWAKGEGETVIEDYYLDEEQRKEIELESEIDQLYLIKWKNLSYIQATWEPLSILHCADKLLSFRQHNRALDKDNRNIILNQVQRHKTLLDLMTNPKKKQKMGVSFYNEVMNRMYCYDIALHKKPIQYQHENQPVYKERKLLRSYQLDSLNWLIQSWYQRRNVILADEMGLGKTIQTTAFLNHLHSFEPAKGPFLVIAPLSTLEHWKRTVNEWTNLNGVLYYDVLGAEGRATCRAYEWFHTDISTKGAVIHNNSVYKFHVLITSYEVFLQDVHTVFIDIPFQYIVIDEAHRLKNANAKILTTLKRMPCNRILLLTGTPVQNNTEELWTLLNYIEPTQFSSFALFQHQFGDLSNAEQILSLHKVVKPYLLRRMKEDVESSIPPLQETIIDVEMTTVQKTVYRALYDKNKSILARQIQVNNSSFEKILGTSLNNLEMQLRKCCNHPFLIKELEYDLSYSVDNTPQARVQKLLDSSGKMILLDKLLIKLIREGHKVLIFSQFTKMLELLEEYLVFRQYKYEKIDGSVKSKERQNAIDRFNCAEKKRDVFILSTKAGGLGINLTSANVVIIFDSDWNPQNDVQATARAHRIGQVNEVKAYRLITRNTYEAQMFERATRKLGLDQAIFMGGDYHSTQHQDSQAPINHTNNPINKKISNNEIELLLKKGILGLLDEDQEGKDQVQSYFDDNIDQILEKNSRIAKYSLINSNFTIAKSSFVSKNSDTSLNINDPKFWETILKSQESESKKYLKILKDPLQIKQYKDLESQKEILGWTGENVNKIIQSKLNVQQFNLDEENSIIEILQIIMSSPTIFYRQYRDIVSQWMDEIERPSRRFKMVNIFEVDLKKNKIISQRQYEEDSQNEYSPKKQQDPQDESYVQDMHRTISNKEKEERLRKLCAYCERSRCLFICEGMCKRSFHSYCKTQVTQHDAICGLDQNVLSFEIEEKKHNDDHLKKVLTPSWLCKDCEALKAVCFTCKQSGAVHMNDRSHSSTQQVHKCSVSTCHKYYHLQCLSSDKNTQKVDKNFQCPYHLCKKCHLPGENKHMVQCFRCPTSYHNNCMNPSLPKISKKFILCEKHNATKLDNKSKRQLNNISKSGLIIKLQLQNEKEEYNNEEFKIKKSGMRRDTQQSQTQVQNGKTKKRRDEKRNNNNSYLSYAELGISSPSAFDYDSYEKDWCRYCGTRFSSNFTKGPWAPRTLCTVHYIEWNQKRKLNLDAYETIPTKPIDLSHNTELDFINKARLKNPEYDPQFILNEPPRLKKVKQEDNQNKYP